MEEERFGNVYDESETSLSRDVEEGQTSQPDLQVKTGSKNHDYCIYCDEMISNVNFSRHLQRNHNCEVEVQKFTSLPKMSIQRKEIINTIRKRGNYILNSSKQCVKPVRKPNRPSSFDPDKYLPCIYCFGYFSKKQLWRHRKKCSKNINKSYFTSSDSQSFLVRNMDVDMKLRKDVFPHMAANENSLAAKKDNLICAYGARYLRTHRGKHHIPVCSRKMQEIAKLLIQIKKLNPQIKYMIDALKPEHYDIFVESAKKVAGYDEEKETFRAPTFAMNIVKAVKDCCDIAMTMATKGKWMNNQSCQETVETLKTFVKLIEANWKYDISSLAAANVNMNKWNKITIVPLAKDIKLLKNHLTKEAARAADKLNKNEQNEKAYRDLLEAVYCRVILLNRKRPGELERLPWATYDQSKTRESYEEFEDVITPTEKVLASRFKRVVFVGKRHRGVPVLFSTDVQEHIALLKKARPNFFKGVKNPYLFGIPGKEVPISGYKTLDKFAKCCGASNPDALKATRLRKHLATITQLFDMNDNEIEQLANFMGHTEGIHRAEYRLPDDVYQTAKICKLLLLMESGNAAKFKGKKLTDININLNEDLLFSNDGSDDDLENIINARETSLHESPISKTSHESKSNKKPQHKKEN